MVSIAFILSCTVGNVDPTLMKAIIIRESRGNPLAINVNSSSAKQYKSLSSKYDVAKVAKHYIAKGYSVDLGLVQINSDNLSSLKVNIETALDPCNNIKLGTYIFADSHRRAYLKGYRGDESLRVALSMYNTGSMSSGFSNGYVDAVWSRYLKDRNNDSKSSSGIENGSSNRKGKNG